MKITYQQIVEATKGEIYPMSLVGQGAKVVEAAVNEGIDAHLEACFIKGRDRFEWQGHRLVCRVSPPSLAVLLRRLYEKAMLDDETAETLLSDILDTLGIENEVGNTAIVKDETVSPIHPRTDEDEEPSANQEFLNDLMTAEEYAVLWGCDPCYDHPPRERGDGYLFYNFSEEGNDPDFLRRFIPAIDRTIEECKMPDTDPDKAGEPDDVEALEALKAVCEQRLAKVAV